MQWAVVEKSAIMPTLLLASMQSNYPYLSEVVPIFWYLNLENPYPAYIHFCLLQDVLLLANAPCKCYGEIGKKAMCLHHANRSSTRSPLPPFPGKQQQLTC